MLVNEEFVHQYLAGSAVGRQFGDMFPDDKGTGTEIVGVVGDVLKDGNDRAHQPEIYFVQGSPTRHIEFDAKILVRTVGNPADLAPLFRDMARETDRAAVVEVTPLAVLVARSVDQPRFSMLILMTFAALALVLASVGLYGVVSYSVAQRRRELGIRAAIGARRVDLVTLVLREGLKATLAGIGIGLLIALGVTRFMGAILFGITPLDGVAFASAPLVLIAVATLACALPAFRAASTDPALALRAE
jgi:putative ABC transport system permease protein